MKVFISTPMRGWTDDEIRARMKWIANKAIEQGLIPKDYEFLDTVFQDRPPDDILEPNVWYLGKSFNLLSQADLVLFDPNWNDARGCRVEHLVCLNYNIPMKMIIE